MDKTEFLRKIALTLEVSIKMAEGWLDLIHPDSAEERQRLEEHRQELRDLLDEIAEFTSESHEQRVHLEQERGRNGLQ